MFIYLEIHVYKHLDIKGNKCTGFSLLHIAYYLLPIAFGLLGSVLATMCADVVLWSFIGWTSDSMEGLVAQHEGLVVCLVQVLLFRGEYIQSVPRGN